MSILNCCPCLYWGRDKVYPETPQTFDERRAFNSQGIFPGYGAVEIVTPPTPPSRAETAIAGGYLETKYVLESDKPSPDLEGYRVVTYADQKKKDAPKLQIIVSPPTASAAPKHASAKAVHLKPKNERRLGGYLITNCIMRVGEVQRKMAAQAMWNFFERPCKLSAEKLRPEISSKKWHRVEPFDGDRVNLVTGSGEGDFNGSLDLLFTARKTEDDPHLKIAARLYQGSELTLDATTYPFKARILLDDELPSASQVALQILDGALKYTKWTFTRIDPQFSEDDFLAGVQLEDPEVI